MLLFGSKNNNLLVVVLYLIGVNQGQKQKWKSLRIFFFFVVFPILMSSAKKINFCNKSLRNGMFQLI